MKNIIKNTFILTVITLVSGFLLGLVYEITKDPIAVAKERTKVEAYQTVMKDADAFDTYEKFNSEVENISGCSVDEAVVAKANGEIVGAVITTTSPEGYGGNIQISVGIANDGAVQGIAILTIAETAGLGMKAKEPEFYNQYTGKLVEEFVVTKTSANSENEITAISGATITSDAVTNAVNAAITYFNNEMGGSIHE